MFLRQQKKLFLHVVGRRGHTRNLHVVHLRRFGRVRPGGQERMRGGVIVLGLLVLSKTQKKKDKKEKKSRQSPRT